MEKNLNLDEKSPMPVPVRSLTRREWVQRMLAGAGAGVAAPALAEAAWPAAVDAQTAAPTEAPGEWKPVFFDEAQIQSLAALAERIVPGSANAQVSRFLDLALGASTQETQQRFVASMNAMEGESLRQFTKSFKDLSASQQDHVLSAASTAKPASAAPVAAGANLIDVMPQPDGLRESFENLKEWVIKAYYSSEVGMKELGWNGENFFESFPGCDHDASHS
jgi:hypothetical protein